MIYFKVATITVTRSSYFSNLNGHIDFELAKMDEYVIYCTELESTTCLI